MLFPRTCIAMINCFMQVTLIPRYSNLVLISSNTISTLLPLIYMPSIHNLWRFRLKPTTLLLLVLLLLYTVIVLYLYNYSYSIFITISVCCYYYYYYYYYSYYYYYYILLYTVTIDIEIYRYRYRYRYRGLCQSYNSSNISMVFPGLIILQS